MGVEAKGEAVGCWRRALNLARSERKRSVGKLKGDVVETQCAALRLELPVLSVELVEQLKGRFRLVGQLVQMDGLGVIDQRSIGRHDGSVDQFAAVAFFARRDFGHDTAFDECQPIAGLGRGDIFGVVLFPRFVFGKRAGA